MNMQFLRKGREVKEGKKKKKKKSQGTAQYHKLYVLQEKMTAYFLGQRYWQRDKIKQLKKLKQLFLGLC